MSEQDYIEGSRGVWINLLRQCVKELGVEDIEAEKAQWLIERQETLAMLRQVCEEHGDNDWSDNLHLSDVIDKHLWKYLEK